MRTVLLTLLATLGLITLAGTAFVYVGAYDVAATRPHWPVTHWVMETMRIRAIKAQAAGIMPPADLMSHSNILNGTEHFAAHCATCHGAPGVPAGDIAAGLYPKPPDLKDTAQRYTPGELFWIVKNGIKMTGMPAWSDHDDQALWGTVAFIQKLPGLSEAAYAQMVMATIAQGGHHHGGDPPDTDGGAGHH
ncbi:MAG: cytochrome c [Rhodospirillales bacterium]|nr:cytochrome c [Rhodospirillales bacterium]MBN8904644.1 cytochrome c [Rhodospirillales bacterium]